MKNPSHSFKSCQVILMTVEDNKGDRNRETVNVESGRVQNVESGESIECRKW